MNGLRLLRAGASVIRKPAPGLGNRVRLGFRVNLVLSKGVRAVQAAPLLRFTS